MIAPAPLLWRQLSLEASHGRTFRVRPSGLAGSRLLAGQGLESGSGRALFDTLMLAGFTAWAGLRWFCRLRMDRWLGRVA